MFCTFVKKPFPTKNGECVGSLFIEKTNVKNIYSDSPSDFPIAERVEVNVLKYKFCPPNLHLCKRGTKRGTRCTKHTHVKTHVEYVKHESNFDILCCDVIKLIFEMSWLSDIISFMSTCALYRNMFLEYYDVVPLGTCIGYCGAHMCKFSVGCTNRVKYHPAKACELHLCEYPECVLPIKDNYLWCERHKCAADRCHDKIASMSSHFCIEHKCSIEDCNNIKYSGAVNKYKIKCRGIHCLDHMCRYMCKYDEINAKRPFIKLCGLKNINGICCVVHAPKCKFVGCDKYVNKDYEKRSHVLIERFSSSDWVYCDEHECKASCCHNHKKENSNYCVSCACSVTDCVYEKFSDFPGRRHFCSELHMCIGYKDFIGCDNRRNNTNKYCDECQKFQINRDLVMLILNVLGKN